MEPIFSKARSFKRHAVTLVILLLLVGAYYAAVIPKQTHYFTKRYFRLLAGTSDELELNILTLCENLMNATAKSSLALATSTSNDVIRAIALIPNLKAEMTLLPGSATPLANRLSLRVATNAQPPALELEYAMTNGSRIVAQTELSRLIGRSDKLSEFDDVLLVSRNGEVVYQLAATSLRLKRLDVPVDKSYTTNRVNFAGDDFRLFAQPMHIVAPSAGGGDALEWALCGLVRADHFRERTWAIDYRLLAFFMFAALMLVVSWPCLNVWGGGLKGGLRIGETLLLSLSVLFTSALLTLLVLDRFAYSSVKHQVDENLRVFADRILAQLDAELKAVAEQLAQLDDKVAGDRFWTNRTNVLADKAIMDVKTAPYPWFRMMIWTDPNGQQTNKWTIKGRNTPFLNVASRAYFRAITEGRAWTKRVGDKTNRFYLEPLYSRNTGENLAIYSAPSATRANMVCAIDLRLLSLLNPLVPPGYGFAVLDAEGWALFHADEQRNLRENFFDECGNSARLRAAVYGRTANYLHANYFLQPHQLFVTPIKDLPWSLVVFRDETLPQLAQIEIVSVAGLLFLIYGGTLVAVFAAFFFAAGMRALRWIWPHRQGIETYWLLTQLHFALVVGASTVALLNPEPWLTCLVALAAAGAGLILTWVALEQKWQRPNWLKLRTVLRRLRVPPFHQKLDLSFRHGYVAAMGLLLILLAVVPALALFRISSDREAELLIKHAQIKLAGGFQARADRVRAEVTSVKGPKGAESSPIDVADRQAFISLRLSNRWDVYDFNFQHDVQDGTPPDRPAKERSTGAWFSDLLRRVRPNYTEADVEPGGLWQDAASDGVWRWTRERGELVLRKDGFNNPAKDGAGTLSIRSALPRWPMPGLLWAAAFALLLVIAPCCTVYAVARRLLLLCEAEPAPRARVWGIGKHLLLGPPHANKSEWATPAHFKALDRQANPPFLRIDLRRAEDRQWLDPARQDELYKDAGLPIVVDHLEYNLTDAKFNRAKFYFLQQFAYDERRSMIVVSNVHPLHFPVDAGVETAAHKPSALVSEKQQRAELLAAFKRIYKENELDERLVPLPTEVTLHRARAHYRSVWATCSPKEQEILHQVALGRLIGSGQPEIRLLRGRGLLELDPELRLIRDQEFRFFILSNYQPDPDEADESSSPLQAAKGPAITALIAFAAFLYLTQPGLWQYTIALVPGFMAGIGALVQVFNLVRPKPKAAPAQE